METREESVRRAMEEKDIPQIEVNGFVYKIDMSLREIRERDRPFNTMPFENLELENERYQLFIDHHGLFRPGHDPRVQRVQLEQFVKLVPEAVAMTYGLNVAELPENDGELCSNPQVILERERNNELPLIRIIDEDYMVDIARGELTSCSDLQKIIPLIDNDHEGAEVDDRYVYLYNYRSGEVIFDLDNLTKLSPQHVFIVIPDKITLDPVAAGELLIGDGRVFLDRYPVQQRMEARVVDPQKTWLAERVKMNAQRLRGTKKTVGNTRNRRKI